MRRRASITYQGQLGPTDSAPGASRDPVPASQRSRHPSCPFDRWMTSVPPSGITSIQLTKNTLRSWRGARGGGEGGETNQNAPLRVKKRAGLHRRAAKTTALSSVSPTSSPGTFFLLLAEIKTCLSTPPGLRRGAKWGPRAPLEGGGWCRFVPSVRHPSPAPAERVVLGAAPSHCTAQYL